MPRKVKMTYVKTVRARGRLYYYFDTGTKNEKGQRIYAPLPDAGSPDFGASYASYLAARTRRQNATPIMTVARMAELFEASPTFRKLRPATQTIYSIHLAKLVALVGNAPADELEPRDMAQMIDRLSHQPGTANLMLSVTGSLYKWGRTRGHTKADPVAGVSKLAMGSHDPWPADLVEAALQCDQPRVRLLVHLLYFTGQRVGDVLAMRWDDLRDGRIEVTQEKTGKALSVPVHNRLADELASVDRTGAYIVTTRHGRRMNDDTARKAIQDFAGKAIVPHGLRKNAVNALLEAGCTVPEAAAVTGQSLRMVEYYAAKRNQPMLSDKAMAKWQG